MAGDGQILICPDCAEPIPLPAAAELGQLVECPNCAGLTFRLLERGGALTWTRVHRVSCPGSDAFLEVLDGTAEGTVYHCGAAAYTLTYAFGSYALERLIPPPR